MPARVGGICALLAFVTFTIGSIAGGLAQPDAYSFADDDLSDLGAVTAYSAWLYNQVTANLSGLLVALVGLALWRALRPDILGRIGAAALVATGISYFFDGIFRLDCRGIDAGCENVSWHSHAHKIESRITLVLVLVTPFILALAFRRNPEWRGAWLPTLLAVPAGLAIGSSSQLLATAPRRVRLRGPGSSGSRSSASGSSKTATCFADGERRPSRLIRPKA